MPVDEAPLDRATNPSFDLAPLAPGVQHDEHRIAQMTATWRYTPEAARYELDTRPHRPWRGYAPDASARIATAAKTVGREVSGGEAAGAQR